MTEAPPATKILRSRFGTGIGFVLSGIGAAVGLGSFWRFPQLTSQNGGGAFVLLFLVMLVAFGVPLLWAEMAIGQRAQQSPVHAMQQVAGRGWSLVGMSFVLVSFVVLGYYTVLVGMTLKYALFTWSQDVFTTPVPFLAASEQGRGAVAFALVVALATGLIVTLGVAKGLEKANLVMMPSLFVMLLGLVAYALVQPGAPQGLDFYLGVNLTEVTVGTVQAALSQVFFAVGIGFGIMLTYASYTGAGRTLLGSSVLINASILVVGLLAGLMVFPLVFSQGLQDRVIDPNAGSTTTLFLTMPAAFAAIDGSLGRGLMFLFFLMLFFAGLSSTIAVLEVVVSFAQDNFGWRRGPGTWTATAYYALPGIAAAMSPAAFTWLDTFLSGILLFVAAIGLCLVYLFGVRDRVGLLLTGVEDPGPWQRGAARAASVVVSYLAPLTLIVIFALSLPRTVATLLGR